MKQWFINASAFEKASALAFLFLATLSCLATAQSLMLTLNIEFLPQWAVFAFAFVVAFAIYALTSYCIKMVIDSQNNAYCKVNYIKMPERRKMFIGGLCGVVFFWLICSFPTNTHSMLYMKEAKRVTLANLQNIEQVYRKAASTDENTLHKNMQEDSLKVENDVREYLRQLDFEVKRTDDPGFGKQARLIIDAVKNHFDSDIKDLGFTFEDPRREMAKERLYEHYTKQIKDLKDAILKDKYAKYTTQLESYKRNHSQYLDALAAIEKLEEAIVTDNISLRLVRPAVEAAYNDNEHKDEIIKNSVQLKDSRKEIEPSNIRRYTIYPVQRIYSVFNVWADFFSGRMPKEFDMLYWILWSAILDIAALIFSAIAFRGKANNKQNNQQSHYYATH